MKKAFFVSAIAVFALLFVLGCASQQQDNAGTNDNGSDAAIDQNHGMEQDSGTDISGSQQDNGSTGTENQIEENDGTTADNGQGGTQETTVDENVPTNEVSDNGQAATQPEPQSVQPERISFKTFDNIIIVGDFYFVGQDSKTVMLLHELGKDRNVWDSFVPQLTVAGFNVIAFDFRGHSESRLQNGSIITYKAFLDSDWQLLQQDAKSARDYLFGKGISKNGIIMVGASIGANAGVQYASSNPEVEKVVLLSGGESYHGITVSGGFISSMNSQKGKTRFLFVSSADDKYSYDSSQKIVAGAPNAELLNLESGGHGTQLLEAHPDLAGKIIDWIKH